MESIIEKMFVRCYADQCFEQALGVALDTHRIDKVAEVVSMALKAGKEGILGYAFSLCQSARKVTPRDFRLSVIQILVQVCMPYMLFYVSTSMPHTPYTIHIRHTPYTIHHTSYRPTRLCLTLITLTWRQV
ncbi:hypothetical protein EON63_11930 [archaeon]|nr:MAG: hypothetical protein EON63_11930 [archaeon]